MTDLYVMFQTELADRIEHDIAPPMKFAATIPIEASCGKIQLQGLSLYVTASPFAPPMDAKTFKDVVERVVEQLNVREG